MARCVEINHRWTTSSTGGGKAIKASPTFTHLTAYFTTSSGCTATVVLQSCAGSSVGPWASLEASTAMSTGACLVKQYSGPLEYIRPYVTAIKASTDVVTTDIRAC
jgi:hypothetical protein